MSRLAASWEVSARVVVLYVDSQVDLARPFGTDRLAAGVLAASRSRLEPLGFQANRSVIELLAGAQPAFILLAFDSDVVFDHAVTRAVELVRRSGEELGVAATWGVRGLNNNATAFAYTRGFAKTRRATTPRKLTTVIGCAAS